MKRYAIRFALMVLGLAGARLAMAGPESCCPQTCEPGYKYVQVIEYHECEQVCCKRVPDIRKKWVYCEKDDHFCMPECGLCRKKDGCCDSCHDGSCGECSRAASGTFSPGSRGS